MMPLCSGFVIVGLILFLPGGDSSLEYVVTSCANPVNSSCSSCQPCQTLDQYAINSTRLFNKYTNYTLVLHSGVHVLTTNLTISDIEGLQVRSDPSGGAIATIDVTNGSIIIKNVSSLCIAYVKILLTSVMVDIPRLWLFDIEAVRLWDSHLSSVEAFVRGMNSHEKKSVFSVVNSSLWRSKVRIELRDTSVSIQGSVLSNSLVAVTSIVKNTIQVLLVSRCKAIGHNALQLHVTTDRAATVAMADISELKTAVSNLSRNELELKVHVNKWSQLKANLSTSNITSVDVDLAEDSVLLLTIKNSSLGFQSDSFAQCVHIYQGDLSRAAVYIHDSLIAKCPGQGFFVSSPRNAYHTTSEVKMYNVLFLFNKRTIRLFLSGSVYVYLFNVTVHRNSDGHALDIDTQVAQVSVKLELCRFVHNAGYRGACIYFLSNSKSFLYLQQVNFYKNYDLVYNPTMVLAIKCDNVTLNNVFFYKNSGTPVEVINGRVILSGRSTFERNIARNGGGLALINSKLTVTKHSTLIFQYNTALDTGGAIYYVNAVNERLLSRRNNNFISTITRCFLQLQSFSNVNEVILLFQNNTSVNGGDVIYGTYVHRTCIVSPTNKVISHSELKELFKIENSKNTSLSAISSDPLRVCICDSSGEPQCAHLDFIYYNITAYSGERLSVPLVVVGEEFGTVTATAYATLLDESSGSLGRGQNAQLTSARTCTLATYSVHSLQSRETVILSASGVSGEKLYAVKKRIKNERVHNKGSIYSYKQTNEIRNWLLVTSVYLNITLEKCPLGFELSGDPPSCQCQRKLLDNNIKHCIITNHTGYVYRSGTMWINATWSENMSNSLLIIHKHCPYDYCLSENISLNLIDPDTQCALGHAGILCGRCQENLSLALGSNRCLDSANSNHMTLLIFFIAAGFALVFFIKALNLTVSKGTINGLVFYANIVWAEQSILFSRQSVAHKLINVFIAWLNLDFGIETCFARGLTAYQKVWLQFVFPVYVWCIVGVMILSSHYSTLATKLFGNNSVPVMATLFLLSYAKLLRTIITVFGYAVLESANGTVTVWLYDGNVPYLGLQHVFLFIAAILSLLFLWLPYMFTLCMVPLLKSKTHYRPFRWIVKWKPFYDAYFGPFREKHQYWIGALLLVRVFLFILFATTSASSPNVNLLAIVVVATCLLVYVGFAGPVYKSKYLSLLENSFILNLNVVAAGVLYQNVVGGDRGIVVYVLVGIVLTEFIGITLYHFAITVKSCATRRNSSVTKTIVRPDAAKKGAFPLREELLDSENSF